MPWPLERVAVSRRAQLEHEIGLCNDAGLPFRERGTCQPEAVCDLVMDLPLICRKDRRLTVGGLFVRFE